VASTASLVFTIPFRVASLVVAFIFGPSVFVD
jgi:hypothetical protein